MLATLVARRLEVSRQTSFTAPEAGAQRRRLVAEVTRDRLVRSWDEASYGMPRDGLALASVGSLSRAESGPLSDLDLVLLHDGRTSPAALAELADRLWYPLWDSGLRLDHSVRTLGECREIADGDIAALTGLLDLDLVAGDADLVAAARSGVARDWRATARRRLPAIAEEIAARHARFGDLSQLIEPDLKEARGGLRDLSVMRALAASWLADYPRAGVDAAAGHLLDVRDALQISSGRPRDRLARQEHDPVAALLGLPDGDALLASVSGAGRVIALAVDSTVRRASQAQHARNLRVGPRRPQLSPLGHGIYAHEGEAVLGAAALARARRPGGDPWLPLRALATAARAGLPPAPATVETLAAQPVPPRPWPEPMRALFSDLLATGRELVPAWEAATVAGIVDGWLPVWQSVRNRPQHDPLHRHTVDRHSVEVVVEARAFLDAVRRPDLLLLAALLHDLGKAKTGPGHAAAGAPLARDTLRGMGYDEADVDLVTVLVAEHLTLVDLATRRDVDDPATVAALVEVVRGDEDLLDLLLALTVADATSVGERSWTPWRAQLVTSLADAARASIRSGDQPLDGEAASLVRQREPFAVSSAARAAALEGACHVSIREGVEPDAAVVKVVAADRLGLFGDLAGALARQDAVVRRAVLSTVDGVAVDRWDVELAAPGALDAESLAREIRTGASPASPSAHPAVGAPGVRGRGNGPSRLLRATSRRGERARGAVPSVGSLGSLLRTTRGAEVAGPGPTQAHFAAYVVPEASERATVVELRGPDRPGLLRDVGHALARLGIAVRSAHVETYAGRCLDTFYLVESAARDERPGRLSPARVAEVISVLVAVGEGDPPGQP